MTWALFSHGFAGKDHFVPFFKTLAVFSAINQKKSLFVVVFFQIFNVKNNNQRFYYKKQWFNMCCNVYQKRERDEIKTQFSFWMVWFFISYSNIDLLYFFFSSNSFYYSFSNSFLTSVWIIDQFCFHWFILLYFCWWYARWERERLFTFISNRRWLCTGWKGLRGPWVPVS